MALDLMCLSDAGATDQDKKTEAMITSLAKQGMTYLQIKQEVEVDVEVDI
jgi:hypothetical protein